jgi:hypothetical protein
MTGNGRYKLSKVSVNSTYKWDKEKAQVDGAWREAERREECMMEVMEYLLGK